MSQIPAALKGITPYVRRAAEVEKTDDPRAHVVAYFCRTYAMEQGLKISQTDKSKEVQGFLLSMLDQLEKEKKEHPDLGNLEAAEVVVTGYAQEKLAEAEDEYLGHRANKNTARKYYAAASFFEVLATFKEEKKLDDATKKSSLFAKWRATEILKAIKEGRPPIPDEDEDLKQGIDEEDDEDDMPPPAPTGKPQPRDFGLEDDDADEEEERAISRKPAKSKPKRNVSRQNSAGASGLTEEQKADAAEYTRFALRAIETDDIKIAIQHLESALRELGA